MDTTIIPPEVLMKKSLIEIETVPFQYAFGFDSEKVKYEASDVTLVQNNKIIAICEDSWNLFGFGSPLNYPYPSAFAPKKAVQIPPLEDSRIKDPSPKWETIIYTPHYDKFIMIRESAIENQRIYSPSFIEAAFTDGKWVVQDICGSDFETQHVKRGFEGGLLFIDPNENLYVLGLCEGNSCVGGKKSRNPGNGMLKLMQKVGSGPGCQWKVKKDVYLPEDAYFTDYSSISRKANSVAITSQESSALWLGELEGVTLSMSLGIIKDIDAFGFKPTGKTYYFPRDKQGNPKFCCIDGIAFLTDYVFVAVSDKTKAYYDHTCREKDQSIHIFSLPTILTE